jgi:hypothetical protein
MEQLLSKNEINRIIQSIDTTTSMFKTCNVFGTDVNETHLLHSTAEYLPKTSASLADLIRTDIETPEGTPNVFLKIWFSWNAINVDDRNIRISDLYWKKSDMATRIFGDGITFIENINDDTMSTSLDYEARVYQYITENIILRNISPNFVPLLSNNTCHLDTVIHSLQSFGDFRGKVELVEKLQVLNRMFPTLPMNFIMTGSSQTVVSAKDFFKNLERGSLLSPHEYSSIIFQFFYALYVMSEYRIVHNDNHMGNVLIQKLPKEVTLDLTIGIFNVKFSTKYIVKFFDWDRAYCQEIGENPITSGYLFTRNVSTFVPGRDFSAFVCFMYGHNIPGFNNILNRLIDGPKPVATSNIKSKTIRNGATSGLIEWVEKHPESIATDHNLENYITIPKHKLRMLVPASTIKILRDKLGDDPFGMSIYDGPNVTNIYLQVKGSDLIIPAGYTCHPVYDSADLDVVKYFTDERMFKELCIGLARKPSATVYKYEI